MVSMVRDLSFQVDRDDPARTSRLLGRSPPVVSDVGSFTESVQRFPMVIAQLGIVIDQPDQRLCQRLGVPRTGLGRVDRLASGLRNASGDGMLAGLASGAGPVGLDPGRTGPTAISTMSPILRPPHRMTLWVRLSAIGTAIVRAAEPE
jgi:hypothetical protein